MQLVPITTNVVRLNPAHGGVYSIQHHVIKLEFSTLPLITEDTIKDLGGKYNCKFVTFHKGIQAVILIKKKIPNIRPKL
jgi:hypothetical protein